jgi:hypothetical protein
VYGAAGSIRASSSIRASRTASCWLRVSCLAWSRPLSEEFVRRADVATFLRCRCTIAERPDDPCEREQPHLPLVPSRERVQPFPGDGNERRWAATAFVASERA